MKFSIYLNRRVLVMKLFANNGVTDQTLHSGVSDLCLHGLPVTLSGVSRLQWFNPENIYACIYILFWCTKKITICECYKNFLQYFAEKMRKK